MSKSIRKPSAKPVGPGAKENFDTNPSNIVKTLESEKKMSDNSAAASATQNQDENAPITYPSLDNLPKEIAQDAAQVLKQTEQVVTNQDENTFECQDVLEAAEKALEKALQIEIFIRQFDENSNKAQASLEKKNSIIEQLLLLKGQHAELEGSSRALQANLTACTNEKTALENQLNQLKENVKALEETLTNLQRENDILKNISAKILNTIEEHETKIAEILSLQTKIDLSLPDTKGDTETNLKDLKEKLATREEEVRKYIETLKTENAQVCQQSEDKEKSCQELREQIENFNKEKIVLDNSIKEKERQENILKQNLDQCQKNTQTLKAAFQDFCEKQREYFTRLNGKFDELSQKIDESIKKIQQIVQNQDNRNKEFEKKLNVAKVESQNQ